jgi:transglutaminase-like putative cysteine protease
MTCLRSALLWALCLLALPALSITPESRIVQFSYEILPQEFPPGETVDIYIPLPAKSAEQHVLVENLQSSVPGSTHQEPTFGNNYLHLHRTAQSNVPISATLNWVVIREAVTSHGDDVLSEEHRAQYLAANSLVPVDHEILQPILAEVHQMRVDESPAATARAIYDWVVDNVEYKKIGTGWGNGDTFWACNERYGNCTDFHALFISLARSEGIPARFEIGFPIPRDRSKGDIGGYHCWVQVYLPGEGWIPIDASEASKHPEQRELLYGGQPADRIHFTTGRDIVLPGEYSGQPLNYFIYPHIEVGGKPWQGKLQTRFHFKEVDFPES